MAHVVVAVPASNEAVLIGDCLRALALQQGNMSMEILLLVNNSCDGTAEAARAAVPALPCRLHVLEHEFPKSQANAGHARRLAMAKAAMLTDAGGVVMTTDADGAVSADWVAANLAAIRAGADAVCGRAVIDPLDALRIPQALHDDDALEVEFGLRLERIACLLDPMPHDPWPRHREESGASIAVRREAFTSCGGVPPVSCGEDRSLMDALRRVDARIRHDPEVEVCVSGRIVGRAQDGMADTIRRRIMRQDPTLDDALEPVGDRVRRISARRLTRMAWMDYASRPTLLRHLATELLISADRLEGWLTLPHFGAAWALMEAASPALVRRAVSRRDVEAQTRLADGVLTTLVGSVGVR